MVAQHVVFIVFLFALGACIGSFLNVVVWRLPNVKYEPTDSLFRQIKRSFDAISYPPSHCPKCDHRLAWYDNLPVIGWLKLRGKCRYCANPISARYPIVEAIAGSLFVFYYLMFFVFNIGPCSSIVITRFDDFGTLVVVPQVLDLTTHWPIFALYLFAIAALLGASLIDFDHYIIPVEIPWLMAIVGVIVHAAIDARSMPGSLIVGPVGVACAIGGTVGLAISIALLQLKILPTSFLHGYPMLEVEKEKLKEAKLPELDYRTPSPTEPIAYTRGQLVAEMRKEMLFLMPPLLLAGAITAIGVFTPFKSILLQLSQTNWISGACGALLGGLVGALVVWMTRILGTIAFGREAMGLGDAHLMFGVGAIIGAGAATVAFFLAPFFGMIIALYLLCFSKRREIPYGPYLSLGSAAVMLVFCPIADYLGPGLTTFVWVIGNQLGLQ